MSDPWTSTQGYDGVTHVGPIAVGKQELTVAIFIPNSFHIRPGIDLILYWHGMTDAYGATDLNQFLDYGKNRLVRSAVGEDGARALVIPWLGISPNAALLYTAITASAASFDGFIDSVCQAIAARSASTATPELRSLVLAGHSAGGVALSRTIRLKAKSLAKAISAWCLDCFYNIDTDQWKAWLGGSRSLYCYYTIGINAPNSTAEESLDLRAALKGSRQAHEVALSAVSHPDIPGHYFPLLLRNVALDGSSPG
jgi:hypothetical protein